MSSRRLIPVFAALFSLLSCALMSAKGNLSNLPASSPIYPGYTDEDSVRQRLMSLGPHHIEGIWEFQADGSKIAIEREPDNEGLIYRMVIIRSSNRLLRPGTLMGRLTPSGKAELYNATIYSTDADGGKLRNPKNYTISLVDESSRIMFQKVKSRIAINLWRLVPYLWRGAIRLRENTGEGPDGCVKVFPYPEKPSEPRYL